MSNINEEDSKAQEEIYRFIQDLEFVQCLANPFYIKYLSDKGYLDDDNFINYLKYLLYFKKVEYMKYITFERCLIFLELLQYKEFREHFKKNIQISEDGRLKQASYLEFNDFIIRDWITRNQINNNDNKIQNNNDKSNNINQGMDIDK